jgi:hypothetical protein
VARVAEQREAVGPEAARDLNHQYEGRQRQGESHSRAGAGDQLFELHRPYLIAHWRIILTILYLPRQQDNDAVGTSFLIGLERRYESAAAIGR